jgi:hypothetical protein
MKIETKSIRNGRYRAGYKGTFVDIEIDNSDIKEALEKENIEDRSFQGDLDSLVKEWNAAPNLTTSIDQQKKYHANRIATIIKKGLLSEPILIYKDIDPQHDYLDGGHRVIAAKYLNESHIEVITIDREKLSTTEKDLLWKEIKQTGDVKVALGNLNIPFV